MKSILRPLTQKTILAVLLFVLIAFAVLFGPRPSSAQVGTWTTKAPMPTPRSHLAVGEVNGILYAVGGMKNRPSCCPDPFIATVEAYDPSTDIWTTKASMPTPRADLGVGVVSGIVYALGGNNLDNFLGMATVEAYDPSTDTWTSKASMPTARYGFGVVVINGVLYAVGGRGTNELATLEAYDPATDTWTTKAPMPTPRGRLAAGVVNGILYALGGGDYFSGCFATVEAYNPTTNTWTSKTPMFIVRNSPGAGTVNNVLYAVGGAQNCTGASTTGEVEAYDSITDAWTIMPPMPTARLGVGVGVANGVLYAMGGTTDDLAAFAIVEAFTPAPIPTPTPTPTPGDSFPPTLLLPSNITAEATGAAGVIVTYSASATDNVDPNPVVICSPSSSSTFPLGTTTVHCTATDASSNSASGSFSVTVVDTTPPVLALPPNVITDATSPQGAVVSFSASATDTVDPHPTVNCAPLSGSTFAIGTTTVQCAATDAGHNSSQGSFTATVNGASGQTANLIMLVQGFNLAQGITNSLDTKLQNVLDAFNATNAGNRANACNQITAFINSVMAQSGKQLTIAQANQLIAKANQIRAVQGCP